MRNGCKIIDMDTHVNPNYETLIKYVDRGFNSRLEDFEPYLRRQEDTSGPLTTITIAPYPYERFPGEAPEEGEAEIKPGGKGALEGRVVKRSANYVKQPSPEVEDMAVEARLKDMDLEGRDIDLLIPGTWCTAISGVKDTSLVKGLYRAYHNYIKDYTSHAPDRLKSMILVPGADPEWAVAEVERLKGESWAAAVWPLLPEGTPIDHPKFDPLWEVMNDAHLPIMFHSFFYEPPYFPGYRDIWGNVCVARTAAHPWAAARLLSYLIVGKIFDRFPNISAGVAEVGQGWLPHWVIRLGYMMKYVSGTTPKLDYEPIEYVQMGRFRCGAEPFEGPEMTKACIDLLGENALMHQSDYPHGECFFPETAQMVMDWPIWKDLGEDALKKHMGGNAEELLRLI